MTLHQLIHRAASVCPDAAVLDYWDEKHECPVDNPGGGDTLALFIAWELYETFDPDADDEQQISTAIGAMRRAGDCLRDVETALNELSASRLAA